MAAGCPSSSSDLTFRGVANIFTKYTYTSCRPIKPAGPWNYSIGFGLTMAIVYLMADGYFYLI